MTTPKKHGGGFAYMTPDRQRLISIKGGRTVQALGRGHRWTKEEAAEAGRKGGTVSRGGRGRDWVAPK
jgi:general stress protein YciG